MRPTRLTVLSKKSSGVIHKADKPTLSPFWPLMIQHHVIFANCSTLRMASNQFA